MEESEGGHASARGSFFACYLLTSLNSRFKGCHYIGFTVNPQRRIRQHNGELTAGAWRTHRKRPWDMVLCVYGFSSQVEALQFEWAWQNPMKSLAVKEAAGRIPPSVRGLKKQFHLLFTMLNCDKWSSMDLNVQFLSSKYIDYRKGCPGLPPHMGLSIAPVESLPVNLEEADSEPDDMEKDVMNVKDVADSVLRPEPDFPDIEEDDSDFESQDCRSGAIGKQLSDKAEKRSKPPDRPVRDAAASSSRASSATQPSMQPQVVDTPASIDFIIRRPPVDDGELPIRRRQIPAPSFDILVESPVPDILETSPAAQTHLGKRKTKEVSEARDVEKDSYDWHETFPSPLRKESGETSSFSPFSAFLDRYSVLEPSSIVKRCLQQISNSNASTRLPIQNLSEKDLPRTPPCKPRVVVIIPDDTPIRSSREVIDLTDSPY